MISVVQYSYPNSADTFFFFINQFSYLTNPFLVSFFYNGFFVVAFYVVCVIMQPILPFKLQGIYPTNLLIFLIITPFFLLDSYRLVLKIEEIKSCTESYFISEWSQFFFSGETIFDITDISILFSFINFFIFSSYYSAMSTKKERTTLPFMLIIFSLYSSLIFITNFIEFYIIIETINFIIYWILLNFNHFKHNKAKNQINNNSIFKNSNIISIENIESVFNYFIINLISGLMLTFGISLIYFSFGSLDFESIRLLMICSTEGVTLISSSSFLIGIATFSCGLLIKMGLAPFHNWVSFLYEQFPAFLFVFLQIFTKSFLLYFFISFFHITGITMIGELCSLCNFFILVGTFNLIIGTFGAFNQINLKRLFIYSSMANSSYFIYGLILNTFFQSTLFLIFYILTSASFLIPTLYANTLKSWKIIELTRANSTYIRPFLTIALLNLSGVPPFALFFAKLPIIITLIEQKFFFITIILLIGSTLSVAYSFSPLSALWFTNDNKKSINKFYFIPFKKINIEEEKSIFNDFFISNSITSITILFFTENTVINFFDKNYKEMYLNTSFILFKNPLTKENQQIEYTDLYLSCLNLMSVIYIIIFIIIITTFKKSSSKFFKTFSTKPKIDITKIINKNETLIYSTIF